MPKHNMFRMYCTAAVEYNILYVGLSLKYNIFRVYCITAVEYNTLCAAKEEYGEWGAWGPCENHLQVFSIVLSLEFLYNVNL